MHVEHRGDLAATDRADLVVSLFDRCQALPLGPVDAISARHEACRSLRGVVVPSEHRAEAVRLVVKDLKVREVVDRSLLAAVSSNGRHSLELVNVVRFLAAMDIRRTPCAMRRRKNPEVAGLI